MYNMHKFKFSEYLFSFYLKEIEKNINFINTTFNNVDKNREKN